MQACREGLLQRNKQVPREELTAVRVARQLQLITGIDRLGSAARLVRQQHAHHGLLGSTRQCRLRIAGMRRIKMHRREIRHSRQHQGIAVYA